MGMESVYKLSVILNMVDNLSGQMSKVQCEVTGSIGKAQLRFWNDAESISSHDGCWRRHHWAFHGDYQSHL